MLSFTFLPEFFQARGFPLAKALQLKPEDQFARDYADRLILSKLFTVDAVVKVSELADLLQSDGLGLATVRALLASNQSRFAFHERRWIPAPRLSSLGRSFSQSVHELLESYGGPMPFSLLVQEISRIRSEDQDAVAPALSSLVSAEGEFIFDSFNVSLNDWSFVASDEPLARALALNGVSHEDFEQIKAKVGDVDFHQPGSVSAVVKQLLPVSVKALGAVVWNKLNDPSPWAPRVYSSHKFFIEAVGTPDTVFGPDGTLYPVTTAKSWLTAAVKLAEKIAPTVEVEDAQPIEVKLTDIPKLAAKVASSEESVTATKLLEEFYEITPSDKTFKDDLQNVMTALKTQPEILWVGGDRFNKAGVVPEIVSEMPEPLLFVGNDIVDEEGDEIDIELSDEGLNTTLRKMLIHPYAMDVNDEEIQPTPKNAQESVMLMLKSVHRELGTFPLCQFPTGFLAPDPTVQELVVTDPNGRSLQLWVNFETRLVHGWFEWWIEQPIENGAMFTLRKTSKPNVFDFEWLEQPDPLVTLTSSRMEELRSIGEEFSEDTALAILMRIMQHWQKGADYLSLLAEVNVARRTPRRVVASLLSSYQCFYQRSGSPVWHFDAKKVEAGFDKAKRRFVIKK